MDGLRELRSATTASSNDDGHWKAGWMSSMSSNVWCKGKDSSLSYSESASHLNVCLEIKHQPQMQLIARLSATKTDTSCIKPSRQFGQEGKEPQGQIRELKLTQIFDCCYLRIMFKWSHYLLTPEVICHWWSSPIISVTLHEIFF